MRSSRIQPILLSFRTHAGSRSPPFTSPILAFDGSCAQLTQLRQEGFEKSFFRYKTMEAKAGTKLRTSHHRSSGGERHRKRKRSTISLERTRKGHRQSDQYCNYFKGNIGGTPERRGGAHKGLPERINTILNWTELNWTETRGVLLKRRQQRPKHLYLN